MVDEKFNDAYLKMCVDDPREASLFALSTLAMRHIDSINKDHFKVIHKILFENELDSPEMNKIKDIIVKVLEYDNQLMENMEETERYICDLLYDQVSVIKNSGNYRLESQRRNIKKWWE
jgi:hypothetical protein